MPFPPRGEPENTLVHQISQYLFDTLFRAFCCSVTLSLFQSAVTVH